MTDKKHIDNNSAFALLRSAKVGDVITFGTYPQTSGGTDRTPIKWRVLENSGGELFVLSESILDCKRYYTPHIV
jgi:hypothetical protein